MSTSDEQWLSPTRVIHPCDKPDCEQMVDTSKPYSVMFFPDDNGVKRYCSKACYVADNPPDPDAITLSADSTGMWGHIYDRPKA